MRARRRARRRPGVVSVVVVNYRGSDDTIACLRAFEDIDWPASRLELVVVDNASGDGSADRITTAVPHATIVEAPENLGFAGGCNLGASRASGEYLGLINNDARPGQGWIREAVAAFEQSLAIAAVASKVLDWDGRTVDYVDGSLTWFGMGYKRQFGRPDHAAYDEPRDVLFATGAAMFVRADVWGDVGGFDERYFMFYEDVDLGWHLNLLGHRVRYVPASVAHHRHHASMKGYGSWHEHFLLERNALFTIYKNYGEAALARALPAALALAVRRGVARGGDDPHVLDLAHGGEVGLPARAEVSRETLTGAYAVDSFVEHLPGLAEDRRRVQALRRRGDAELLPLFRDPLEPLLGGKRFLDGYQAVVAAFGVDEVFGTRRRILVATEEPLTDRMAGPAIRAWAVAKALSVEHDVELVTLRRCTVDHPRFACRSVTQDQLRSLERWCDVVVVGGLLMHACPWLAGSTKVLVADVYNPFHLEQLEQAKDRGEQGRAAVVAECTSALNAQLSRGDLFLCASPKQRDFWLGQLAALGRINPDTYDDDQTLRSLVAVVPFGLPDAPPTHTREAIRGVVPGIGVDDKVVLWGGGVYNWLDPLTLLHAVDRLRHRRADVRLFFLGLRHPNPAVPEMRMALATQELAASLGLVGTHVFFNEGWVPYDDRQNYLLEADVGVSTHHRHVETAFSFRTRVLDYLWASLPVVATEGDSFADLIEAEGVGLTVPPEDPDALAEALLRLLDDGDLAARYRARSTEVAASLTWSSALAPLLEFCRSPRRAPDLVGPDAPRPGAAGTGARLLRQQLALVRTSYREGGSGEVARKAYRRLRAH